MSDDRWAFPPQPPAWPPAPSTTPPRRTSPILAVVAVFAATGIIAAGIGVGSVLLVRHIQGAQSTSGSPTAVPGTTAGAAEARALYQQAIASTRASTGFHYVAVAAGGYPQTIVGDAGQSGGRQLITFDANYGSEQFTLLLVGTTVYFQGNVPALEDQLGASAASAPSLVGKWVSLARGNGPYPILQPGITAGSQAIEMPLTPEASVRATDPGGVAATRISGIVPATNNSPAGTGSLDIAPRTDLPIRYTSTISGGGPVATFTTTFSAWGTPPSVTAPTGAIAWSSLTTTAPPGGYGSGGTPAGVPTPTPTATPGAI